jgi:hypothetical protein
MSDVTPKTYCPFFACTEQSCLGILPYTRLSSKFHFRETNTIPSGSNLLGIHRQGQSARQPRPVPQLRRDDKRVDILSDC